MKLMTSNRIDTTKSDPLSNPLEVGIHQLKQNEPFFRALSEKLGDLIWYMDLEMRTRYVTPNIYGKLGFTPAEWIARTLQEQMAPESAGRMRKIFQKEIQRKPTASADPEQTFQMEIQYRHKNQTDIWFQNTIVRVADETGRVLGLNGVARDISKQKRAEKESSRKSLERRLLLDTIPIQVWYLTDAKTYGAVNKAHADFLGLNPKDLAHGRIEKFRSQEVSRLCKVGNETVFQTGKPVHTKEWMNDSRGQPRLIAVTKTPKLNEQGEVQYVVCAGTDITEETRHQELQQRLNQLEKTESLGCMAGAIAHHFNNQLGVVLGNLELVMSDMPPDAVSKNHLSQAQLAATRAADLSGQMLTYLGQTPGKRKPLDLSKTCRRILPMLQVAIPSHTTLKTDLPPFGPVIHGDTGQVQRILMNLLTNALEAVGDGPGRIFLSIKTLPASNLTPLSLVPMDWIPNRSTYVSLEVRDTGCGMDAGTAAKVFDPFYTDKFTGRGLGLPVVLGLVKASGGAINVESALDEGSTFRIFWPLSREEPLRRTEISGKTPAIEGGGVVLLVDDEALLRELGRHMLERLGFEVLTAANGTEALTVFRKHENVIRCVITDLSMPGMNGWETLTELRKMVPDMPVILASGYDETTAMKGEHPENPEAFLGKPFQMSDLKNALGQALGRTAV